MDFIIGGLAGAGATIFTNPMDVVKTRMQLQGELRARKEHNVRYRGIFHALYVIAKTDGAMALQKGLAPAMVLGFVMNSVRLGVYHIAEVQGWTRNKNGELRTEKAMLWSSLSGVLGGVVANPAFVVKTRIQASAHPSIAVGRQHNYKGMWDGCFKIYKTEGLKGYFAGVNATCTRLAIGSAAQLTSYTTAKEMLIKNGIIDSKSSPVLLAFTASSLSGAILSLAMCPFDVITVRLYNQAKEYILARGYVDSPAVSFVASLVSGIFVIVVETPLDVVNTRLYVQGKVYFMSALLVVLGCSSGATSKNERLYTGVIDCLTKIYRTEGLHGLYKGLGPLYLRVAPHTTLSLVIWDVLNTTINR